MPLTYKEEANDDKKIATQLLTLLFKNMSQTYVFPINGWHWGHIEPSLANTQLQCHACNMILTSTHITNLP